MEHPTWPKYTTRIVQKVSYYFFFSDDFGSVSNHSENKIAKKRYTSIVYSRRVMLAWICTLHHR